MRLSIAFLAMILFSATGAEARYNYGGGSHSGSHGGHYSGGFGGSSHRGGTYHGPHGGYGRHS
jgi:hypothetical protein